MLNKVLAVHDLACVGRCSLTVVLPILSAMGIQGCPLPSAILSSHPGGFKNIICKDMTMEMQEFPRQWQENNLNFDTIYTGFLASDQQIDIAMALIEQFAQKVKFVLVDPVMGDDGIAYSITSPTLIGRMRELVSKADIITPNYTEACFLLGKNYKNNLANLEELYEWLPQLANLGPKMVVITGSIIGEEIYNLAYEKITETVFVVKNRKIGQKYPGTGDILSSVLLGNLLGGLGLGLALEKAVEFVGTALEYSLNNEMPIREGVAFESFLGELTK